MNAFYSQQSYPQWSQPPFQGPPPLPNGMNIPQQQWQQGQWQFNPAFGHQQPSSVPSQAQWAPAQNWFMQYNANISNKPTSAAAVSSASTFAAQQAAAAAVVASQQAQAQAQAQANRNPYKKYPKPPSQEYLSYELTNNGLGLFDMVPREEVYKDKDPPNGADQTPWVWHPKRFPGEEDTGIVTAYFKDEYGNRDQQYRGQVNGSGRRSEDQSESSPSKSTEASHQGSSGRQRSGSGILRRRDTSDNEFYPPTKEMERAWEYEGERERAKDKHKKEKHKKEKPKDKYGKTDDSPGSSFTRVSPQKPSSRSTPAPGMSSASAYAEQQAQARNDRSQRVRFESPPPASSASLPPSNSTKAQPPQARANTEPSAMSVPHQPQPAPAHEGFSSKAELRPTFSPRIVRTPDHYRNSSTSSAPSRSPSIIRPASASASIRSTDYSNSNTMSSVSGSSSSQPLQRHATAPAAFRSEHDPSNMSGVPALSDEPVSTSQLLSPLFPTNSHTRSLSRASHHPHLLSSIPEGASATIKQKQSPQRSNYSPAGSGSTTESESNSSSPYWSGGDPHSRSSPNPQLSTRKRSPLSNPLPTPPRESQIALSMPNAGIHHERATAESRPQPGMRIRKGYWSRRGVHLTKDGDLIHPPDDRIFPQELDHYPDDTSVFQDHKGRRKRVEMWKQLPSDNRRIDDYISYVT